MPEVREDEKPTDSNIPPESDAPFRLPPRSWRLTLIGGCILLVAVIVMVTSSEEELRHNGTKARGNSSPAYVRHVEKGSPAENITNISSTTGLPAALRKPAVQIYHQEESKASRAAIDRILLEAKPRLSVLRPEGARPLLCVLSPEAKHPLQFPKKYCTHLIYSDVEYDLRNATFTPVCEATFAVLQTLKAGSGMQFVVNMVPRTLQVLARNSEERGRFTEALSRWLTSFGFNGVAFLGQIEDSASLEAALVPTMRSLKSVLGPLKLVVVVGVTVQDWDTNPVLVARRLAAVGEHLDYLILETHYQVVPNKICRTAFPSVFYSDDRHTPSVPITRALSWMASMLLDEKSQVNTCFSMTLAALLFKGARSPLAACKTSQLTSYMKVCKDIQWTTGVTADVDAFAEKRLGNGQVESHEASAFLAAKVSRALSVFPLSCVAAYQVDMDDYEGECGKPFGRLELMRQAQEKLTASDVPLSDINSPGPETTSETSPIGSTDSERRRRCMARGKESARPLVCVLSDRITVPRNFTKQHCTHIVLSLRRYPTADAMRHVSSDVYQRLKGRDVKVLVAQHEDVLLHTNAEKLAESTAVLLRGTQLDGLAFLYVSQTAPQLDKLNLKLQTLHSVLKASDLCLLLSLQLSGYIAQPRIVDKTLRDVSKNVDILVVNSHYPGSSDVCRAVHTSVYKQSLNSCIPIVAVETALSWLKFIASTSVDVPFLCFSVDLRVFRYAARTPLGICDSEEQLEYSKVCSGTGWSTVYDVATDSLMRRKEAELETFDTANSLRRKVESAIADYPKACVVAFNYDFDDVVGLCKDQRLPAIRAALDRTIYPASPTLREYDEPVSVHGDSSRAASKPLVCVLSRVTHGVPVVPQAECTHVVHREVWYDILAGTIHIKESSLGLIAEWPNIKHVLDLGGEIFLNSVLGDEPAELEEIAANIAVSSRRMHVDGVAILDFNRTSKTIASLAPALSILRKTLSHDLILILGLEVLDGSLPTRTMTKRLLNTIRFADITIFQTHYRSGRGYCQVSYPSVYEYKEGNLVPLATALDWMKDLGLPHTCISFNMAVLEFERLNGDIRDCQRISSRKYSETCNESGWKSNDEISESFSAVREKGPVWQSFESVELLGQKVERALAQHPGACVAAFNVDLEDATPACEAHKRRFSRISAIAERYVKAEAGINPVYQQLPRMTEGRASIISAELVGSPPLHRGNTQPPSRERPVAYQRTNQGRISTGRPFVCFMSREWVGANNSPPSQCTHVALWQETAGVKEVLAELKRRLNSQVEYLVAEEHFMERNNTRLALAASDFNGVAIVNLRIRSIALESLGDALESFRHILSKEHVLVVGLELLDFHQDADLIAKRLEYVHKQADIVIFQTHFRKGSFCRTAYPSVYHPSVDNCTQTPPIVVVLRWMELVSFPNMCVSFNFAALRFHLSRGPGIGELCQNVEEIKDLCGTEEWKKSEDGQYSLAASRYLGDIWISHETERLLERKISGATQIDPKMCVAVFNTDFDGSSTCRKAAYSRVNVSAVAAGYKKKDLNVQEPNVARQWGPLHKLRKLVCVCTGSENPNDMPADYCDYYVYGFINYGTSYIHIFPDVESVRLMQRFKRPGVKILAAFVPNKFLTLLKYMADEVQGDILFHKVVGWLFEYNLDGMGTVYFRANWSELDSLSVFIHRLGCKLHSAGFEFVIGITITDMQEAPMTKAIEGIRVIARSVDILILESHMGYDYPKDCHVHFPSRQKLTEPNLGDSVTIDSVAQHVKLLSDAGVETPICFSLSMGVRTYELEAKSRHERPGATCDVFRYDNYSVTCDTTEHWSVPAVNAHAQSTWRWKPRIVQTYDSKENIFAKVLASNTHCAAVYEVELDDPYDACKTGDKFPRIQSVHQSFETIAKLWPESKKIITADEPVLICVVTDKKPTVNAPCDHFVYYAARYVGGEVGLEDSSDIPLPSSPMAQFLGQGDNDRRFVSLTPQNPSWFQEMERDNSVMTEFGSSVTKFLLKHALRGLAFLRLHIYGEDASDMWRFLQRAHCDLSLSGRKIMLGIHLKDDASPTLLADLKSLSRTVDIFIVETHLEPFPTAANCVTRYPTSVFGTFADAGTIPIQLATKWFSALPKTQPLLCYSVSMAAFQFDNSWAPVGGPCQGVKLVDISETCKKGHPPARTSHLAVSSFQTTRSTLTTYDSKADLVIKVDFANTPCVAAYDVDYDDPEGVCDVPVTRTKMLNESLYELAKSYELTREEYAPHRAMRPLSTEHTMICVFSEETRNIDLVSFSVCDYIAIQQFELDSSLRVNVNAYVLEQVRRYSNDITTIFVMMVTAEGLVSRYKSGQRIDDLLKELVVYMTDAGFWGIAFSYNKTLPTDLATQTGVLAKLRDAMRMEQRAFYEIMLVVPLTSKWIVWSRSALFSYIDHIIFLTHNDATEGPCKIRFSSSYTVDNLTISNVTDAAMLINTLQKSNRSLPHMCFSLSMAVLQFDGTNADSYVGDPCTKMSAVPYERACPKDVHEDEVVSAFMNMGSYVLTYEDEETLAMKMVALSGFLPRVCVATFHTDMEDFKGNCSHRPQASRLRTIRSSLSIPENVANRPGLKNPLLCTLGKASRMTAMHMGHCDMLIFTDVEYDEANHIVRAAHNQEAFAGFMTYHEGSLHEPGRPKRAVALDAGQPKSGAYGNLKKLEDLALHMALWLNLTKLDGLAIFADVMSEEVLLRHTFFMEKMHSAFVQRRREIILIYGSSIIEGHKMWPRSRIATYVDVLVLMVHRNTWTNTPCIIAMPNTFDTTPESKQADIYRNSIRGLETVVSVVPAVAVSIQLAVRQFRTDKKWVLHETCLFETWVYYETTCGGPTWSRGNFSGSYQTRDTMTFRTFETEDSVRIKVMLFNEWVKGMGVVLFNVEYESPFTACGTMLDDFSRLKAARRATNTNKGVNEDMPVTFPPVFPNTTAPDPIARPDKLSDNAMACIYGKHTTTFPRNFPKQMCDAIILMAFTYYGPSTTILHVTNTRVLNAFLWLEMNMHKTPHYYLGFEPESFHRRWLGNPKTFQHFAETVAITIHTSAPRVHGIFMQHGILVGDDPQHFSSIIFRTRQEVKKFRHEDIFLVGMAALMPLYPRDWEQIMYLVHYTNLTVMLSHRLEPSTGPCRVDTPSTIQRNEYSLGVWKWTQNIMVAMVNLAHKKSLPPMCFSINMVVLNYSVPTYTNDFGGFCHDEQWTGYAETCPTLVTGTYVSSSKLTAYTRTRDVFKAFESEDTLRIKTEMASREFPRVCVAAYNVEFEDEGNCTQRRAFSRMASLRRALNNIIPKVGVLNRRRRGAYYFDPFNPSPPLPSNESIQRTYIYGEPSYKKKRRRRSWHFHRRTSNESHVATDTSTEPTPSVCYFNAPAPGLPCVAKHVCTYTIYDAPDYDKARGSFYSADGTWESAFAAAVANSMNLVIGTTAETLLNLYYEGPVALEAFLNSILNLATRADGLLGISVSILPEMATADVDHFPDVIRKARTSLDSMHLEAIFVVSPAAMDNADLRKLVADTADTIVYAGNVVARTVKGNVSAIDDRFPGGILRSDEKNDEYRKFPDGDAPTKMSSMDGLLELSQAVSDNSLLCVSINLAVYECTNDGCRKANYSDTCKLVGRVDPDYSTMRAKVGSSVFIYDNEATLLSKLNYFRQLYPFACVALLNADTEDHGRSCGAGLSFSRLAQARSMLDGGENITPGTAQPQRATSETPLGTVTPAGSRTPYSTEGIAFSGTHHATLICLSGHEATVADITRIPATLCNYIVYPPGSYDHRRRTIKAIKPIDGHKGSRLVLTLNPSSFADRWVVNATELVAFANTLLVFIRDDQWTAFGIFLENPDYTSNVVAVHSAVLTLLRRNKPTPFQLVVGSVPLQDGRAFFGLVLGADFFIMMTQHISRKDCTVQPPTRTPALRAFIADQSDNSLMYLWRNSELLRALICAPINLGVFTYQLKGPYLGNTGDHCVMEAHGNYAQTCNKTTTTDANAAYYSTPTHLTTFENEATVVLRMLEFYDKIPDPCVAAFYADSEDSTGLCTPAFSRLKAIRARLDEYSVSNSTMGTTPFTGTSGAPRSKSSESATATTPSARRFSMHPTSSRATKASITTTGHPVVSNTTAEDERAVPGHTSVPQFGNTLLCFMSPQLAVYVKFPKLVCDVIIYDALCLRGDGHEVIDAQWKAFLEIRKMIQSEREKFAANLDSECLLNATNTDKDVKAVVTDAASLLVTYNLSAGAVVVQDSRHESVVPYTILLQQYRFRMNELNRDGTLIFGASPNYLANNIVLKAILQTVDILIYVDHHTITRDEPCRVSYPSGMFFENENDRAVESMQQNKDKIVCKSVNMAVFRFAIEGTNDTFGSLCRQEIMDSYGQVCPSPRVGAEDEPAWFPIHYKDRFNLITYESETTLQEKILALRKSVTRACIAAFHVEFEVPTGKCPHRPAFSRIKGMRNVLDNPVDYIPPYVPDHETGTTGTVSTTSGYRRLANEPSAQARLVCFLAPPVKTLQKYPSYLCDYIVYQSLGYNISSKHMSLSDEVSWTRFLKLKKPLSTRLMVSIDSQSIVNVTRASAVDIFVNEVQVWLQNHHIRGVGVLFDSQDDALHGYETLKVLRERLDQFQHGAYVLLIGASAALPVHLVQLAHTFVFVTNHVPSATSCQISYPSVTTHVSTLSEPLLLAKSLREVAGNVSVCLSINLAILVFWQETMDRSVGAKCKRGAETDFAELCKQAEVKITPDKEWMSAYLQTDENNTLYTFETGDMLATKVSFFKSWFPDICVAAFHTERDVYEYPCPRLPPFSRLIKIGDTLYGNHPESTS
ncbi:uncharacterized protein LOC135388198 isoform X2 [Ornithodoros turicata]|uniref:uncharacterized protein LOC135388198 isoform X2 n=1 Tax=Ornithodoros turicata TaxID=34597 RepID=UPI003138D481